MEQNNQASADGTVALNAGTSSENASGGANASGGSSTAAMVRKDESVREGGSTQAGPEGNAKDGDVGSEEEGVEAFFAAVEFDSIESITKMRAKVLKYLEERGRQVGERCDEIEHNTDTAVRAIKRTLRTGLIRLNNKIKKMTMGEFRAEFGAMEGLVSILGPSSGSSRPDSSNNLVAKDAPLGDHGTVVSGMEIQQDVESSSTSTCASSSNSSSSNSQLRTPPGGSASTSVPVKGTALILKHAEGPAALGDDAVSADVPKLALNQDVGSMDDETKQMTKKHLIEMQRQIDEIMNKLN